MCNVSINSDHPPGDLGDSRGLGFRPTFFAWGIGGFELEKFSTVLKEKCRNFSICFKETGDILKSSCSCAVSCQFLQKR